MVASIPRSYQVDLKNSYRLAGLFSQWGGLVHLTGKHLLVAMFRISNPWSCAGEPTWVMEEVFVAKSRGQL
jgi:hypothetical protein